jgi:TPR repeat protein
MNPVGYAVIGGTVLVVAVTVFALSGKTNVDSANVVPDLSLAQAVEMSLSNDPDISRLAVIAIEAIVGAGDKDAMVAHTQIKVRDSVGMLHDAATQDNVSARGDVDGAIALARLLAGGIGVERDPVQAIEILERHAAEGSFSARMQILSILSSDSEIVSMMPSERQQTGLGLIALMEVENAGDLDENNNRNTVAAMRDRLLGLR